MSTTSDAPAANASTSSSILHDIVVKQYVGVSRVAFNDDLINPFPAPPRLYALVFLAWLTDVLIHMPSS
jgi:hypothetical protein